MDGRGPPRRFASIASCAPLLAGRAGAVGVACAAALGRHFPPFSTMFLGGPLPSPLLFCSVLFLCVCSLPTAAGARTPEEEEDLLFVAAATAPPNPTESSSPFCSRRAGDPGSGRYGVKVPKPTRPRCHAKAEF